MTERREKEGSGGTVALSAALYGGQSLLRPPHCTLRLDSKAPDGLPCSAVPGLWRAKPPQKWHRGCPWGVMAGEQPPLHGVCLIHLGGPFEPPS